jgi:K+-sensing histidine kinase KdpD
MHGIIKPKKIYIIWSWYSQKKDLHHIFFIKTSNAQKESYGIGLNLAKNIIEKDNGYITVSSVVGQGTKFVIRYLK